MKLFSFTGKILIIGGGIANFTNVSATFKVCIKPVQSFRERSKCKVNVKKFVYPWSTKEFTRTHSEISVHSSIELEFGNIGF